MMTVTTVFRTFNGDRRLQLYDPIHVTVKQTNQHNIVEWCRKSLEFFSRLFISRELSAPRRSAMTSLHLTSCQAIRQLLFESVAFVSNQFRNIAVLDVELYIALFLAIRFVELTLDFQFSRGASSMPP
jgi:hypothetical protein